MSSDPRRVLIDEHRTTNPSFLGNVVTHDDHDFSGALTDFCINGEGSMWITQAHVHGTSTIFLSRSAAKALVKALQAIEGFNDER